MSNLAATQFPDQSKLLKELKLEKPRRSLSKSPKVSYHSLSRFCSFNMLLWRCRPFRTLTEKTEEEEESPGPQPA